MTNLKDREKARLAFNVGRTKKLYEAGQSAEEISKALNVSESSVRSWIAMIENVNSKK